MSCAFLKGIYFTGTAEILLNMMLGKEKKLPFQSVVWWHRKLPFWVVGYQSNIW